MAKFRKIAVLVEAVLVSELVANARSNWNALPEWVKERYEKGGFVFLNDGISTKDWKATLADYLICDANGGIYPCKPDIFEQTYESAGITRPRFMAFGEALEAVKRGSRIARKGWNGKGMFVFMRPADELHVSFVAKQIKSLPQSVKDYYYRDCVDGNGNEITDLPAEDVVKFTAYLCMKAADGTIVNGWLASQTDMLSEDWEVVD